MNLPKLGNWDLFLGVGFGIIFTYKRGGENALLLRLGA